MVDQSAASASRAVSFGPFRLLVTQRLLLEGDRPVRLGSRAMDILIALVERCGELLSKRELMKVVWPDTVVVEANLTVHVAALRRALGDGQAGNRYIVNVPGRGYRFVAPLAFADEPRAEALQFTPPIHQHNLPAQLTRLIGRAEVVGKLIQQLQSHRLFTIVGAGGIGKTAVALEVAEHFIPAYEHGVWLIDLAPIADPRLVPTALASALKLEIRSDDPPRDLIAAMRDKEMLLVLDNCEHVIEAAAALTVELLKGSRGLRILATSREPLRVAGERVHRLSPLESPHASLRLSGAEALRFPAVQLFVERAAATMSDFELSEADAPSAGDICRQLDGIPLAIEFAAARVITLGVRGLATQLHDRLRLLAGSRRTALPRHRTIGAALEWSYHLLSQEEQTVLRRLAVFAGSFTLEAASAVVADVDGSWSDIADHVAGLVTKSLVAAAVGDGEVRFRLLETTRAYALAKLTETGEARALGRGHSAYYLDVIEAASKSLAGDDVVAVGYAPEMDNIRAALAWAFGPGGDGSIAVALAAATAPIWLHMSLLTECHDWMGKALDLLDTTDRGTRREMVLQIALGLSLMFTQGMSGRARVALTRAIQLAENLHEVGYRLRALAGLTRLCLRLEEFQNALLFARQSEAIGKGITDPVAMSTADYILSDALFFLGDYAGALTHARRAQNQITPAVRRALIGRSGMDHSIQARCVVTQVLWSQGLLDQSAQTARDVLVDAEANGHPISLCEALTWCGCTISLRLGDFETAERSIARLKHWAEQYASSSYHACGLGFEGQLSAKRGDIVAGERLLRSCLEGLREGQYEALYTGFLSELADVLASAGNIDESLAAAGEALQRAERNDGFWWMPEALRIKGEVLMLSDKADTTVADGDFRRSLDLAHRQGALSWELRTAMSLGRLRHAQGRTDDARHLLESVYARFAEGFETADLRSAKQLLEDWTLDFTRGRKA